MLPTIVALLAHLEWKQFHIFCWIAPPFFVGLPPKKQYAAWRSMVEAAGGIGAGAVASIAAEAIR